jgi:hypothetical protein
VQVEEFKQGDAAAAAPAATPAQAAAAAQAAAKPAAAPTSILAPQEPLKPPEDEQYTVHVPEGLRLQVRSWFRHFMLGWTPTSRAARLSKNVVEVHLSTPIHCLGRIWTW